MGQKKMVPGLILDLLIFKFVISEHFHRWRVPKAKFLQSYAQKSRGCKTFVSNCIRVFYEAHAHTLSEKHSWTLRIQYFQHPTNQKPLKGEKKKKVK